MRTQAAQGPVAPLETTDTLRQSLHTRPVVGLSSPVIRSRINALPRAACIADVSEVLRHAPAIIIEGIIHPPAPAAPVAGRIHPIEMSVAGPQDPVPPGATTVATAKGPGHALGHRVGIVNSGVAVSFLRELAPPRRGLMVGGRYAGVAILAVRLPYIGP